MVAIYIFEENHKCSEKTPHLRPHSFTRCGQPGRKQPREQSFMPEFVQPTIWNLSNTATGLQVSYSVAGPHLHYHQGPFVQDFTGNQIRVVEAPDLGTLVSVTIHTTADSGSTTFTLLLPIVNLPAPPALPAAVPVTADAITTRHRFSRVLALQQGQQEFYTVTALQGTAS